jgi:hypothetical protein
MYSSLAFDSIHVSYFTMLMLIYLIPNSYMHTFDIDVQVTLSGDEEYYVRIMQ